jgi:hypothetical protein
MANKARFVLVGVDEPSERDLWLAKMLDAAMEEDFDHIALVAWHGEEEIQTARFNMSAFDIATAAQHLQFDAIDRFIAANFEKYQEEAEDGDLEEE